MKIYVVGNILVDKDSLPLRILPKLRKTFVQINFIEIDPNENFIPLKNEPLYILDTVIGIDDIVIFHDLDSFGFQKSVSPHDYDLLFHLKLLEKLDKLPRELYIVGIPFNLDEHSAFNKVQRLLRSISTPS